MKPIFVPIEALVVVWCVGIGFGYFLAWMRFKKAYLLIDREKLKLNQAQAMAVQSSTSNTRCSGST